MIINILFFSVATVTCDEYGMKLFITEKISFDTILLEDKGILFDNLKSFLHLFFEYLIEFLHRKSRCQYFITDCEFKGDSQEIRTDLDKCGTTVSYNNTHVIYKNQVRIRYSTFTVIFVRY